MSIFFWLVLWLLPVVVGWGLNIYPRRLAAIAVITVFLSWTIIGWVFAMIMAVEAPSREGR